MELEVGEADALKILESIRLKYRESKIYYNEYLKEEDRIGITSPNEWINLYNTLLKQFKNQDELVSLRYMENLNF